MSRSSDKSGSDSEIKAKASRFKRPRGHEDPDWQNEFKLYKDEMLKAISCLRNDMTIRLNKVDTKLDKLSDIEKTMEYLAARNEELTREVSDCKSMIMQRDERILALESQVDDLSRKFLSSHIEIRNVPKLEKESKTDLHNYIRNLSMSLKIEPLEVRDVFRWSSKSAGHPAIVVELNCNTSKNTILRTAKVHNLNNPNNRLSGTHLGIKDYTSPIFIGEHLTSKNRRLFYLGRQMIKAGSYKYCWTAHGKVYVRKTENSTALQLRDEEQIDKLKLTG